MSNAFPSRLGMVNGTGADDVLFLKQFSGETLTAFEETNVMMSRHYVRTISSGKSAQFPAVWKNTASYHTPGEFIRGKQIKHAERVITIDDLLISDVFIARIDEAKNHYDVRSIYTKECGAALAREADKNVLQTAVLAARAPNVIDEAPGGARIGGADSAIDTDPDKLVQALFQAAEILDTKDVPANGRFMVVKPAQYYLLVQSDKLISRDFSQGNGDFASGKVLKAVDMEVVKSNNVPQTNIAAPAGTSPSEGGDAYGPRPLAKYAGDFTGTVGVVMTPQAVGTVKLLDLAVEGEYKIERQGTLIVAKYAMGHGILRPECAVELTTAALV
ncbi:phage capsid protein [Telmatospirillum sp. J64-1]|uniref:phage capsid protein n=1 Tax=Telmatospirillum sp. J64-1 TaxID=2502183 RepID=UPI00115C52A1|nr:phage capsid protein [Telmatospirillum sp. J64-1]